MKSKPILITLVIILCLGALGFGGYLAYQKYQQNNQPPKKESISVEGEVVCLPHKDTSGPQTLECAAGLKTTDEKYYGLSTDGSSNALTTSVGSKKHAKVNGTLEPAGDTQYNIQGIIAVESYELAE